MVHFDVGRPRPLCSNTPRQVSLECVRKAPSEHKAYSVLILVGLNVNLNHHMPDAILASKGLNVATGRIC